LSNQDSRVNVFTHLGLTIRQAEVYLAIVELGQPTVRSIAQTLQIARAEVYRVIPELQKLGLIKENVTTPFSFRATPLSEGLSILLELDTEKHKLIRSEAKQFLLNFKNHYREKPSQENSYYLTLGPKPVERNYLRDLVKLQKSKDCILDWNVIIYVIARDFGYIEEALEKGVKIRYITHIPEGTKIPQNIQNLTKTGSFEVKSASTIPKAGLDIFDKEFVHIITIASAKQIEVLRSNNPAMAELAQDYFELKWQSATAPCWYKKKQQIRV
jgi:sugar-specific transcriptional regulator TrmB